MAAPQNIISVCVLSSAAMSVDDSVITQPTGERPVFLSVKSGDVVIVWDNPSLMWSKSMDWWVGQIL